MAIPISDGAIRRGPSLAEQAYDTLARMIISGSIAPGAVLSENDLARQLAISRSPLREAIRRLQDERMLDESGPRGFSVPPITTEFVTDLYQVRRALEGEAARLARGIPASELRRARQQMREIAIELDKGNGSPFTESDFDFHNLFIGHSGNPMLVQLIQRLRGPIQRVRVFANPLIDHIHDSFHEHEVMLSAMEDGDSHALQVSTLAHIDGIASRLLQHIDKVEVAG